MNHLAFALAFVLLAASCTVSQGQERPLVHPLFTDHMVIQRDADNRVWGWDKPGSSVSVSFNGQQATAVAAADGRWETTLKPSNVGGPHEMTIEGSSKLVVKDVLVGDVWLCSGQSNMQWSVQNSNDAKNEIAAADHPKIRLFSVPKKQATAPQALVEAKWEPCNPDTIPGFSAVGYYFGRSLQEKLEVPIGLIHSSWGGTVAEAWVSRDSLQASMPDFHEELKLANAKIAKQLDPKLKPLRNAKEWWQATGSARLKGKWRKDGFDAGTWKKLSLPNKWEGAVPGMDEFDGIVRFRRSFDLPESSAGKEATLSLGKVDDDDTTWVNGTLVGSTQGWNVPRKYKIPAGTLRAGTNVVAVRVVDKQGGGGIYGEPAEFALKPTGDSAEVTLAGEWSLEPGKSMSELPAGPAKVRWPDPNIVTGLYNAMIAPLTPYQVRGSIWYQGESNAGRPKQYLPLMQTLISDWRKQFENPELPFFIVQLANFQALQTEPVESGWADIRESQQLVADQDPKVGLAVITDIGAADNIHPRNKQDVGKRLALSALKVAYGQDLVHAGPAYKSHAVEGGTAIRIQFENVGGGLQGEDGRLKGFAIAGDDGKFAWADATVDGDSVVLTSGNVTNPVHVRYNWANNPVGNLFNAAGLPAAPFRTDGP